MRKLKQLLILIQDYFEFRKRKTQDASITVSQKSILILVKNPNLYHRFFYIFLKQFQLSGYQIFFPMNLEQYRNIKYNNLYFSWIVNEPQLISISNPDKSLDMITIKDQDLSADFFHDFFHNNNVEGGYHVPMTYHPMMFHELLDHQEITINKNRTNSLYTFGNFEKKNYSEIDQTPFKLINRYKLLQYFSEKENYISIKSQEQLDEIFLEKPKGKFIFSEKQNFNIPIEKVREYLSNFDFFLACPGVIMPHCHNIIEAMSVGTIPILQESYADMFYPPLRHLKEVLVFKDEHDLESLLDEVFDISDAQKEEMRQNIFNYFQNHLTPEAISGNILKALSHKSVFLNAEHRSVHLI